MKYRKENKQIFLTLAKGDFINESITEVAIKEGIKLAWINGIGALENIEIGYFNLPKKGYAKTHFQGEYELTSLIGNITLKDDEPYVHTHITFSDTDYIVRGGHLFDAQITAAGEFFISMGENPIHREMNKDIGLALWCLAE